MFSWRLTLLSRKPFWYTKGGARQARYGPCFNGIVISVRILWRRSAGNVIIYSRKPYILFVTEGQLDPIYVMFIESQFDDEDAK
jgi:hypothetical protein